MENSFSTKGFYDSLSKGKLSVLKCRVCENYVIPPTSICNRCLSTDLEWVKVNPKGRVISFSEVFVSNHLFRDRTPYVVSVIETDEGVRLAGIIRNATAKNVKVGDPVSISIDREVQIPNYFFTLAKE